MIIKTKEEHDVADPILVELFKSYEKLYSISIKIENAYGEDSEEAKKVRKAMQFVHELNVEFSDALYDFYKRECGWV